MFNPLLIFRASLFIRLSDNVLPSLGIRCRAEPLFPPLLSPVALQFLHVQHLLAVLSCPVVQAEMGDDVGLIPMGGFETMIWRIRHSLPIAIGETS